MKNVCVFVSWIEESQHIKNQESSRVCVFPVWDLRLTTFESDNFQSSLWMEQRRDSCTITTLFFFKVHTRKTHSVFLSASFTSRERLMKAPYADVACACHSLLTVIPCATTAVNWLKSALIVCVRLSEETHISLSFRKTWLKLAWPFFKSCFSRHKNRNQMACRETKAFLPFWTSHSLRLGAQALHKMSIDKFSSAYVTHAQFESYWWGRKRHSFHFSFPLLMIFFCGKAANMSSSDSSGWQGAGTGSH